MAGNGNEPRWGLFLEVLLREIPLSESSVSESLTPDWPGRCWSCHWTRTSAPLADISKLDVTAVRTAFAKWHRPGDLV